MKMIKVQNQRFQEGHQKNPEIKEELQRKNRCFDKWNIEEDLKYASFLRQFKEKLETEHLRRISKVFVHMSKQIETKNAQQCRTHHQKMAKGYGTIDQIITHINRKKEKNEGRAARKGKRGRPRKQKTDKNEKDFQLTSEIKFDSRHRLSSQFFLIRKNSNSKNKNQMNAAASKNEPESIQRPCNEKSEITIILDLSCILPD